MEKFIIKYCNATQSDNVNMIERSMINYYYLRNKSDKTKQESFWLKKLGAGIDELFVVMSENISKELGIEKDLVYNNLKSIHIKT